MTEAKMLPCQVEITDDMVDVAIKAADLMQPGWMERALKAVAPMISEAAISAWNKRQVEGGEAKPVYRITKTGAFVETEPLLPAFGMPDGKYDLYTAPAARALLSSDTGGDDDETYEIGKRDGYSDAVQQIDVLTGGDGEYRYCTDHDPDRHTPDPPTMIQRIVDRFDARDEARALGWKEGVEAAAKERSQAAADVIAERERHVSVEGWTPAHDDLHTDGSLAKAAAAYALASAIKPEPGTRWIQTFIGQIWPWSRDWWKPKDRRRNLVVSGSLIIAEIERLDRAASEVKALQNASKRGPSLIDPTRKLARARSLPSPHARSGK